MTDEVNQISFDEFDAIFRSKNKNGETIRHEEVVRAWNIWQTQNCFLCNNEQIKFRALFEPGEERLKECCNRESIPKMLMYSLCDICFENKDIEYISECLLMAAERLTVH